MNRSVDARELYLLGCGGHGRVVLDALLEASQAVAGIIDAKLQSGASIRGVPVIGGDEQLLRIEPSAATICIGVGSMPGQRRRAELFRECKHRGFAIMGVIHPTAILSKEHRRGEGVQVLAGAVVQCGVQLGDNVVVNTRASIDHDSDVADSVMIGPGAVICGGARIGAGTYVGAGAVLLPGVIVGCNAIIGAGGVVTRDVADGVTIVGNPGKALSA